MQVLIMRHGEAVDSREAARDSERHLTLRGRRESATVAERLHEHALVPTHVYTSPFVRAVQTAEVVCGVLGLDAAIPAHPPLVPGGGSSAHALAILDDHDDADRVLLVSHEPTVRVLSSYLGQLDFPAFPTSGVAVFEFSDARRFLGRLDPRLGWRGPDDRAF